MWDIENLKIILHLKYNDGATIAEHKASEKEKQTNKHQKPDISYRCLLFLS